MAHFSIEWDGLAELGDVLEKAVRNHKPEVQTAIRNNTEEMKTEAKRLAPVDTWFMHDNIYTFHGDMYGEVISSAGYSGFVNFGTRFMMAQPFMTDSFTAQVKKLEKTIEDIAKGLF